MQSSFAGCASERFCVLSSLTNAGLRKYVLAQKPDEAILLLCDAATKLHSQTAWLLTDREDDVSNSDTESSSSSDEDTTQVQELVHRVRTYTNCLIDLGIALDNPALEPEHDDGPSLITLEQRSAHDYHTDLIKAKFPDAEYRLLQNLGHTSWDRYQRMQQERDLNAHTLLEPEACTKSQAASSEFQDSGIGTSLPQTVPTYAETIVSFISSISDGNRVNIPPLSAEAKKGLPFECNACGKLIRATNNREWR